MGRFDEKYSVEQKEALYELTIDQGLTVKDAVAQLEAEGVVSFNYETAKQYVAKERQRRIVLIGSPLVGTEPRLAIEAVMQRCMLVLDQESLELMRDREVGKSLNLGRVQKIAAGLLKLVELDRARKSPAPTAQPDPQPKHSEEMERLLAKMSERSENGAHDEARGSQTR